MENTLQLELKVPPPVVFMACASVMGVLALLLPGERIALPAQNLFAGDLAFGGAVIAALGVYANLSQRTTLNPTKPEAASVLVTGGAYSFSRNPMYAGLLLVLLGWAMFLGRGLPFLLLPAFVVYMNRYQIVPEEEALAARFGDEYSDYRRKVRRWL